MTLNILFMSITVKKRLRSLNEHNHDILVNQHFEETKLKQESVRIF